MVCIPFVDLFIFYFLVAQNRRRMLAIVSLACSITGNVGEEIWNQNFSTDLLLRNVGESDRTIVNVTMMRKQNALGLIFIIIFMKLSQV